MDKERLVRRRLFVDRGVAWCFGLCVFLGLPLRARESAAPVDDWATLLLLHCEEAELRDSGRGGLPVQAEGLSVAAGRFGKAIDFQSGGRASFKLPMSAQPVEEFTLECWIYLRERGSERLQRIVGRGSNYGFYIGGKGAYLSFFVAAREWRSVNAPIPLGEWIHIAGTFDGANMRLYVNGRLVGEAENAGRVARHTGPYFLGMESSRERYRFLGLIDEVRVSKVARVRFMTGEPLERSGPTVSLTPAELDDSSFVRVLLISRVSVAPRIDGDLDEAVWQGLPAGEFVKTGSGDRPAIPTSIRAVYDDRFLYLAYRCIEKGQETYRPGPRERDSLSVFKSDAVEALLQPGGAGTVYVQIAMNPEGGIFDARYPKPRKMTAWDGSGIRTAGDVGADLWTLEAAIPFADLGVAVPRPGDEWRGNFCRNEVPAGELSTWSRTGGSFHELSRFGVLRFIAGPAEGADSPGARSGSCELRGSVVERDGRPVPGVPIRTLSGQTRTDLFGEFRLCDLPPGAIPLQIKSPRFVPATGTVTLRRPEEVLAPIILERVDPYAPAFGPLRPDRPIVWFRSSIDSPPDMTRAPTSEDLADELLLRLTPGEYETGALAFYANADLKAPRVKSSDLVGPEGRIAASRIDVRWTMRLLKRIQYKRLREDAVFTWRFLWRTPPEEVRAGQVRQLTVTIEAPDDLPRGLYTGKLFLTSSNHVTASIPFRVQVAGFRLARPEKRVGCYYSAGGLSAEQQAIELADIREHGGSVLIWHTGIVYGKQDDGTITYDVGSVREAVELQRQHGLGPPFLVGTNPRRAAALAGLRVAMTPAFAAEVLASKEFRRIYGEGVRKLDALQREMGAGEFLYTWMDEVFGRGRFEPWRAFSRITREITDTRIYITLHNRNQELVDQAAPWVDVRCYHGHTLDAWQEQGHTWEELAKELAEDGDEAWTYYNIREIAVTSEWVRLCNGYWLWRSPLRAHVPWKYYSYGGSPFDDLDSERHDFAYAAPHPEKPEMVSTLEWECFREGYDDLRYLTTFEQAIAAAERKGIAAELVAKAREVRNTWWQGESRVPALAEALSARDYDQRRETMIRLTEKLLEESAE